MGSFTDWDAAPEQLDADLLSTVELADASTSESETVLFGPESELRTYRLAIATTAEYTSYHGGTVFDGLDAVNTVVDRLNEIFERELSIRFELVPNNHLIIHTDPADDPYTDPLDSDQLLIEVQADIDARIGDSNYDIGHIFSTASGGVSHVGVLGRPDWKARGTSGLDVPLGDRFFLMVAHEIGHQLGAQHTWNGDDINDPDQWFSAAAMEPGSGSTIMSYAGIMPKNDNLQNFRDDYFHSCNLERIIEYVDTSVHGAAAGTRTPTGNLPPTVDAGSDHIIPARTPFSLTATGTDANGDALTYAWEQRDISGIQRDLAAPDDGVSPLFRSWPPTSDPTRTFPRMPDLLDNTTAAGETLPTTNRDMNFRVTARDNHLIDGITVNGATAHDDMLVRVIDTGTPFAVTAPNTPITWTGTSSQAVTWNVGGTDANGIGTTDVKLLLSTDGGRTFPIELAVTANDGEHDVTVPNVDTTQARIMIQGDGNIFFDVSNEDFAITLDGSKPGITLTETDGDTRPIEGGLDDTYTLALNTEPTGSVTVTVTADAQTLISTDGANFASTQDLVLMSTDPQIVIVRAVDDSIEEGPHESILAHAITNSADANYSLGMPLDILAAHVYDDELPPMVGVDFDYVATTAAPDHWTHYQIPGNHDANTITDLPRDDGATTPYDLTFQYDSGFFSYHFAGTGASSTTKPRHNPSLTKINGFNRANNAITMTWSDLTPSQNYGVYIFGLERSTTLAFQQTVTITGTNDSSTSFTQTLSDAVLHVNDEVGTDSRTLVSFEEVITADDNGNIKIAVQPNAGSDGFSLGGLAIREIPTPTHTVAVAILPTTEPTPFEQATTGEVNTLPSNSTWIDEWHDFYVEIWLNTNDANMDLAGGSLDLTYDTQLFSATAVEHGPAFDQSQSWTIDDANGTVGIGASTLSPNIGDNAYALLARVRFEPTLADAGVPLNANGTYITPVQGQFNVESPAFDLIDIDSTQVEINSGPKLDVWPVMYDIDNSGRVDFGDLAFFAASFQQNVTDPGATYAYASDFDRSGKVDFGDLAFFAANFQRESGDGLGAIQYPANFPDAWQTATLTLDATTLAQHTAETLTEAQLAAVTQSAVARVESTIEDPQTANILGDVRFEIVDLPGNLLGRATGQSTIQIDLNAAGHGWFVDTTPWSDQEFSQYAAEFSFSATPNTEASTRVDLLTTVMHELNHVLGFDHSNEDDLMAATLPLGTRRLWNDGFDPFADEFDLFDENSKKEWNADMSNTEAVDEVFAQL